MLGVAAAAKGSGSLTVPFCRMRISLTKERNLTPCETIDTTPVQEEVPSFNRHAKEEAKETFCNKENCQRTLNNAQDLFPLSTQRTRRMMKEVNVTEGNLLPMDIQVG